MLQKSSWSEELELPSISFNQTWLPPITLELPCESFYDNCNTVTGHCGIFLYMYVYKNLGTVNTTHNFKMVS